MIHKQGPTLFEHFNRRMESLLDNDEKREGNFMPPFDVVDTGEAYVLIADIAGITAEDVEVEYHNGRLQITGVVRSEVSYPTRAYLRTERNTGRFERSFEFTEELHPLLVQADYSNGVLTITAPKMHIARATFEPAQKSQYGPPVRKARARLWVKL